MNWIKCYNAGTDPRDKLVTLLRGKAAIQADLNSESFLLHDLIERESTTTPDESRGRETVLSYEAIVSAV